MDEVHPSNYVNTTASIQIAERIRLQIQSGELTPGTRLRQNEVAERFGVSTTPVREAFQVLQAQGWVRIDPRRGAVVFSPTVKDVREAFEIRIALEQLAIRKAVWNVTESGFAELEEINARMSATNDAAQWRALNTQFHMRMYEFADSPRLLTLIENLSSATLGYSQMATLNAPRSWWADEQHGALLQALRQGDSDGAQKIIEEHLNLTVSFLVELLQEGEHN